MAPPPTASNQQNKLGHGMLAGLARLRHNSAITANFSNNIAKIRRRKHIPSVVHVFSPYLCEETYKAVCPESCNWVALGWVSLQAGARPQKCAFVWHTTPKAYKHPGEAKDKTRVVGTKLQNSRVDSTRLGWSLDKPHVEFSTDPTERVGCRRLTLAFSGVQRYGVR